VSKETSKSEAGQFVKCPPSSRIQAILLVDGSRATRLITKWFLGCVGCVVHAFAEAEEALAQFDPKIHALVITDNSMPRMTGAELAHIIKLRSPATPVLMYTGALPADRSCLDGFLQKTTPLPVLKDAVDKLLKVRGSPRSDPKSKKKAPSKTFTVLMAAK
jgi:FixJ family two-component response regulator